jgi:hypothetical protein
MHSSHESQEVTRLITNLSQETRLGIEIEDNYREEKA